MRRFVLGWKQLGHQQRLTAHIVNYADDLVICCRARAQAALTAMQDMMTKLKLTVNQAKTRVCQVPDEKFDFLGYTFGRCYSPQTGRAYLAPLRRSNVYNASVRRLARRPDAITLSKRQRRWWRGSTGK